MNVETAGHVVDNINVEISYRIIELFSAGLYSSPNKAFEELVCNSYDALADKVAVFVPQDLGVDDAAIWVCDNGESMDSDGLRQLWKIGESEKRHRESANPTRKQIGQFGIGKLSTYILANRLTYICKKDEQFRAVTMRYDDISKSSSEMTLDERVISEDEAEELLLPLINKHGIDLVQFNLFGENAEETWTFSILTRLKTKATEITEGRLKWVLRTAIPLNPGFELFYNGNRVTSSKISKPIRKTWTFGRDDETAQKMELVPQGSEGEPFGIEIPGIGRVYGKIDLFEDSLVDGSKSSELGRSHGIFLIIRERLVNLDDPLLGLPAFSHGAFNRTRIEIKADGLDDYITSTRESVKDSKPFNILKSYIQKKFNNEVKVYHFEQREKSEQVKNIRYKLSKTSLTATKRPLLVFARKFFEGSISNPFCIKKPSVENKDLLLQDLAEDLAGEENVIKNVDWEFSDSYRPISTFDLETGQLKINLAHPYIASYHDAFKDILPLQIIAITEVLTEAHLYELDVDEDSIRSIMVRRDHTLRELSLTSKENAPNVAMMLRDASADSKGLEEAVASAFSTLGFEVVPIGGNGTPDGLATAVLGYSKNEEDQSYSLTFDAKSSAKEKIKAATTRMAILNKHKKDYGADYVVVVAPDFEGASDPESTISVISEQQGVTAIRIQDLVRLVLLSSPKQLGLKKLRGLLEDCKTPEQVKAWIDNLGEEPTITGPTKELFEEIFVLQKEDSEVITIAALRMSLNIKLGTNYSVSEITERLSSLKKMANGFIDLEGDVVGIQCTPEKLMSILQQSISQVPTELRQTYIKALS